MERLNSLIAGGLTAVISVIARIKKNQSPQVKIKPISALVFLADADSEIEPR